jgi:hypothetical protein
VIHTNVFAFAVMCTDLLEVRRDLGRLVKRLLE